MADNQTNALIGASGLIGGVLAASRTFAATARSTTISALEGQSYDTLFIAAARGSMFEANKFPERDLTHIDGLIASLAKINAQQAVLISTIAVLEHFDGGSDERTVRFRDNLAYGRNRRRLEEAVGDLCPNTLVVRLPALFGAPIKKNFIFDLMNPAPSMLTRHRREALLDALEPDMGDRLGGYYAFDDHMGMWVLDRVRLDVDPGRADLEAAIIRAGFEAARFVNPDSSFQFYDLRALSSHIDVALEAGLETIHLAPPPLTAGGVHECLTGRPMPETDAKRHREDMRTGHAQLFGHKGPYLGSPEHVLDTLNAWVAEQGGAR